MAAADPQSMPSSGHQRRGSIAEASLPSLLPSSLSCSHTLTASKEHALCVRRLSPPAEVGVTTIPTGDSGAQGAALPETP